MIILSPQLKLSRRNNEIIYLISNNQVSKYGKRISVYTIEDNKCSCLAYLKHGHCKHLNMLTKTFVRNSLTNYSAFSQLEMLFLTLDLPIKFELDDLPLEVNHIDVKIPNLFYDIVYFVIKVKPFVEFTISFSKKIT